MNGASTVFVAGSAFIVYVLAVYPGIVAAWARLRPRPIRKRFEPKTVSVLLPVYNGEDWIGQKLHWLQNLDYPRDLVEILVLVDGANDRTAEYARACSDDRIQVIELPRGGKAAALNAGLRRARHEILLMTDVRQELDPHSLRELVSCFADPQVGAASGELMIRAGANAEQRDIGLYWKYEKFIRSRVALISSIPGVTGALFAMRRSLASPLPNDTLLDDVFLPMCAYFQGFRIVWEPRARCFDNPTSLATEFRRKVRTLAGVYQIVGFFPRLLLPTHSLWFFFCSHKLSRLLLPYALIAVFVASFGLPRPAAITAVAAQLLFYGMAALDGAVPVGSLLKRITSPARTFVVLVLAAACAVRILFVPPQRLWVPTEASRQHPPP
jgi:poly-beta-1,6-N-acetyl-D-glucosamine synthase